MLVQRSNGSFLWAKLVLKQLHRCPKEDYLLGILEEFSTEPTSHYQHVDRTLLTKLNTNDHELARTILMWANYCMRQLNLEEMAEAVCLDGDDPFDVHWKIDKVCGDFIAVDSKSRVTLSDRAASEYLSERLPTSQLGICVSDAHFLMFKRCLSTLSDLKLSEENSSPLVRSFLGYAVTSWFHHLLSVSEASENSPLFKFTDYFHLLEEFFDGPYVLHGSFCSPQCHSCSHESRPHRLCPSFSTKHQLCQVHRCSIPASEKVRHG